MKNYSKKTQTLTPLIEVQRLLPIELPFFCEKKCNRNEPVPFGSIQFEHIHHCNLAKDKTQDNPPESKHQINIFF